MIRSDPRRITWKRAAAIAFASLLSLSLTNSAFPAPRSGIKGTRRAATEEAADHVDDALHLAKESREALDRIEDYTALFTKVERVGEGIIEQTMDLKLRHRPFSVYVRFRSVNERGREALYVAGANDGRLLVHQPGVLGALAGTHRLKIDEWPVTLENRYPVTEIGVGRILEKSISVWKAIEASRTKSCKVRVIDDVDLNGVACQVVEVENDRRKSKLPVSLSRVYFAQDSRLPIRAEQYGWPIKPGTKPPLLEIYSYQDMQLNVGLTDADFDPENPQYGFAGNAFP